MKSVHEMRVLSALLVPLAFASILGACGSEPIRDPFVIQINSQDIVQPAVDRIEIVMRPMTAGQRFTSQADMSNFGGSVASRVTGAGEFAIFVERAYIDANARPGDLMNAFFVDVPVLMASDIGQDVVEDPLTQVTFIRGAERIGDVERFLEWPLVDGAQAVFRVMCDRPDFARQCTNNNPIPVADTGMMMPDGGM